MPGTQPLLASPQDTEAQRGEVTRQGCTASWRQSWGPNPGLPFLETALFTTLLSRCPPTPERPLLPPPSCLCHPWGPPAPGPAMPLSLLEACSVPQCPPCLPCAALPAVGPLWLATSCCRETLSLIFLTTRWPPLPPLNKLHRSNGWSTAEARTGRVGN